MYDALFREVGAIRARDFSDLLDLPAALATGRRLGGHIMGGQGVGGCVGGCAGEALGGEPQPQDLASAQRGGHAPL